MMDFPVATVSYQGLMETTPEQLRELKKQILKSYGENPGRLFVAPHGATIEPLFDVNTGYSELGVG